MILFRGAGFHHPAPTFFTMKSILPLLLLMLSGCGRPNAEPGLPAPEMVKTFAQEVDFLKRYSPVQVLEAPGGARVALSAAYQGRVMTSAVSPDSPALGWINHQFIEDGKTGTQFDNFGGEDRFWLGPEGGQYALYFEPGSPFTLSSWQVPAALQEGEWNISNQTPGSITFTRPMQFTNYRGSAFKLQLERTVRLLTKEDLEGQMGFQAPDTLQWVGFESINQVTNTGDSAWVADRGMPSIWILGMFNPFDTTNVVIPFSGSPSDSVVNDLYFGEIPPDRLDVRNGYLLFLCDGQYRSKIGIGPAHAKPVLGSYTESQNLLTLIQFSLPKDAVDYVNSMWEQQAEPYGGDVVNSYNDGPLQPGQPSLGGFYELETSSPALALGPGESFIHTHRTLHLVGDFSTLDPIARTVLGVPLSTVARGIR